MPAAHRREARRAVPDGDHEVGAHEDVQFAEIDLLGRVQIAGRAQDDEECVAVALSFGRWCASIASSTASGCRSNSAARERSSASVVGRGDRCHAGGLVAQLSEGVGEGGGGRDPYAVAVQGRLYDAVSGGFRLRRVGARRRRHAGRGRRVQGASPDRALCRSWRSDGRRSDIAAASQAAGTSL